MTTTTPLLTESDEYSADLLGSIEQQLKISAVLTIAFAVMFSFGSHDATDGLVRWFGDLMFWRLGEGPDQLTDINHLADAVLGGVMASWATFVWLLADRFFLRAPREVKSIIMTAMFVWFPIDTIGSIVSGAWLNGIANLGFLAMFVYPISRLKANV